jgi:hypothetical protein
MLFGSTFGTNLFKCVRFPTISKFNAPSLDCHVMSNICLHICKLFVIESCEGDIAIDVAMIYKEAFYFVGFFGI